MKKYFLSLLTLVSCTSSSIKVAEDNQTLYSRLSLPIENSFLGLKLQFYSLFPSMYGYVICEDYTFDSNNTTTLTLTINKTTTTFECPVLAGSQKLFLPKDAVIQIIHGLKDQNRIHIAIEADEGYIDGDINFAKKYALLCKNLSLFDKIAIKGAECLDINNYQ